MVQCVGRSAVQGFTLGFRVKSLGVRSMKREEAEPSCIELCVLSLGDWEQKSSELKVSCIEA